MILMPAFICFFGGTIFLIYAAYLFRRSKKLERNGITTTGKVISVSVEIDEGNRSYTPLIRFQRNDGSAGQFMGYPSSYEERYTIGKDCPVIYDPASAEDVKEYSKGALYNTSYVMGSIGTLCLLAGLIILFTK